MIQPKKKNWTNWIKNSFNQNYLHNNSNFAEIYKDLKKPLSKFLNQSSHKIKLKKIGQQL